MFKKKTKVQDQPPAKATGPPSAEIAALPLVKYPRPKILLVDMDESTADALQREGYNVSTGTFGRPYEVPKGSNYGPVIIKASLPNYTEQELIVVDLVPGKTLDGPKGEKMRPMEELDWWAKCSDGLIDPRPRAMAMAQKALDRIMDTGGAFVIFADSRDQQDMVLARQARQYSDFYVHEPIRADNWGFLSVLSNVVVTSDIGEEMRPADKEWPIVRLLADHLAGAGFSCTLEPGYRIEKRWLSLATNKYGATTAGLIAPEEGGEKGWVFIFPQLPQRAHFLQKFLKQVLPGLSPPLFPHAQGQARWLRRPEYELPRIRQLEASKKEVRARADAEIERLSNDIKNERASLGWMHGLITTHDQPLVAAVKNALGLLGFQKVMDIDAERDKEGKSRREDLQIHDRSPVLVVDVKGVGGIPSDDEALQADKHATIRIREWSRIDVVPLTIINHQRHLPPLDRENKMPFRQEILDHAAISHLGLLTTWDLFRIIRNVQRHAWRVEDVQLLLYKPGRIEVVPSHYHYAGTVAKVWTDKFGVVIEQAQVAVGDTVAVEFPVEFEEVYVPSLQVMDKAVQAAGPNDPTGLLWPADRPKLREGQRVFLVKKTGGC
jgi:hypothetical protein